MSGTLALHRGGWEATKADLAAVPVPEPTESYHPVPYGRFIEEVELHVPRFGLKVQSAAFALAKGGNQMFGVLTCVNGKPAGDYAVPHAPHQRPKCGRIRRVPAEARARSYRFIRERRIPF